MFINIHRMWMVQPEIYHPNCADQTLVASSTSSTSTIDKFHWDMDSLRPGPHEPLSRASSVFDLPSYEQNRSASKTPEVTGVHSTSHQIRGDETFIVISGGTGCNAFCGAFDQASTCYVLPVTDDGGSSSEIIRVIGLAVLPCYPHALAKEFC
jgi:hypothetical protein